MKEIELSNRLKALTDMVTVGNTVADVGCDHGFLSIYLVQNQISPRVLAMDVRKGPLQAATTHVEECGLSDYITTRLSDGIKEMEAGECETLVVAGMGGRLMTKILTDEEWKTKQFKELILQPQSELPLFRRFLRENGYSVIDENILCEDGKYYFMMKALPRAVSAEGDAMHVDLTGKDLKKQDEEVLGDTFGKMLLEKKHPVLREFLLLRQNQLHEIIKNLSGNTRDKAVNRLGEIKEELGLIEKALEIVS